MFNKFHVKQIQRTYILKYKPESVGIFPTLINAGEYSHRCQIRK